MCDQSFTVYCNKGILKRKSTDFRHRQVLRFYKESKYRSFSTEMCKYNENCVVTIAELSMFDASTAINFTECVHEQSIYAEEMVYFHDKH